MTKKTGNFMKLLKKFFIFFVLVITIPAYGMDKP